MPLSIFVDALPFSEVNSLYRDWFPDMQVSLLQPNIAYSSSLHWQLYCDKYPDDRGMLVDWVKQPEKRKSVKAVSFLFSPLDYFGKLGYLSKKFLDRYVYRSNTFANIPYRFRRYFTQTGQYLFWKQSIYGKESLFDNYTVVSQDEGHYTFDQMTDKLNGLIEQGEKNIFACFGFADSMGHKCRRGEIYSSRLKTYMDILHSSICRYIKKHPEDEILIISDHGMSTVKNKIDLKLESVFGKQSKKTYIAYSDSAVMCIWSENSELKKKITDYLSKQECGHLLTDEERIYYRATDKKLGDIIFILKEGNVFEKNWFGISLRKPSEDGSGMHGFWPSLDAKDQMACVMLINGKRELNPKYDYSSAHLLIDSIMGETLE